MTPAERHRAIASRFTTCVLGVRDWDAPTPVPEWRARDVVAHLVDWSTGFLAGAGVALPRNDGTGPAGAWQAHAAAVQALLDDPGTAGRTLANPHVGELPLADAVDRFYTTDVLLHTWDLARATGQDDRIDPATCEQLLQGMAPAEAAMRSSGHYGPRVEVAADADPQTRLVGFLGRDPAWRPPQPAAAPATG